MFRIFKSICAKWKSKAREKCCESSRECEGEEMWLIKRSWKYSYTCVIDRKQQYVRAWTYFKTLEYPSLSSASTGGANHVTPADTSRSLWRHASSSVHDNHEYHCGAQAAHKSRDCPTSSKKRPKRELNIEWFIPGGSTLAKSADDFCYLTLVPSSIYRLKSGLRAGIWRAAALKIPFIMISPLTMARIPMAHWPGETGILTLA